MTAKERARAAALAVLERGGSQAEAEMAYVDAIDAPSPSPTPTATETFPFEVPTSKKTDLHFAVEILEEETGSREKALEALTLGGSSTESMTAGIKARREAENKRLFEQAKATYDASPDGRLAAAMRAEEASHLEKKQVAAARELLREEWTEKGESVDLLDDLSADEILDISGIRPSPERLAREADERILDDPAAAAEHDHQRALALHSDPLHYLSLAPEERTAESRELGIDPDTHEAEMLAAQRARVNQL